MGRIKYPCRNCIYFSACGSTSRTEICKGRMNKREKEKALAKAKAKFLNEK